jgi:hypothetical protein
MYTHSGILEVVILDVPTPMPSPCLLNPRYRLRGSPPPTAPTPDQPTTGRAQRPSFHPGPIKHRELSLQVPLRH